MNCHRCGGAMILKKLCEYGGYCWGWGCLCCGAITDQIAENGQLPKITWDQNREREEVLCDEMEERGKNGPEFVWCGV